MTSLSDKLKEDILCLTANLYFEARGEGVKGLKAVADVTLNRVKSKKYPSSVCKVVFQKSQFSWVNEVP
jgi:spore germination cell wall hydrolase CwlJ-like protein